MKVDVKDVVNHPEHYETSTSMECIQVMKMIFGSRNVVYFCLLNAFKYLWRYKHKNGIEDIKKAEWYLNYAKGILDNKVDDISLENHYWRMKNLYEEIVEKESEELLKEIKYD